MFLVVHLVISGNGLNRQTSDTLSTSKLPFTLLLNARLTLVCHQLQHCELLPCLCYIRLIDGPCHTKLFMGAIGLVFAPLAPLVPVACAVVMWISSWVYKYQLMFVFVSKVETGGVSSYLFLGLAIRTCLAYSA